MLRTIARYDGTPFPATAKLVGRWARGRVRRPASIELTYCAEVVAATYQEMGLLDGERPTNYYDPGSSGPATTSSCSRAPGSAARSASSPDRSPPVPHRLHPGVEIAGSTREPTPGPRGFLGSSSSATVTVARCGEEEMSAAQYALNLSLLAYILISNVGTHGSPGAGSCSRSSWSRSPGVFLNDPPTAGNDLRLELVGVAAGTLLGVVAGLWSGPRQRRPVLMTAGAAYAALWVLVIGGRMLFATAPTTGSPSASACSPPPPDHRRRRLDRGVRRHGAGDGAHPGARDLGTQPGRRPSCGGGRARRARRGRGVSVRSRALATGLALWVAALAVTAGGGLLTAPPAGRRRHHPRPARRRGTVRPRAAGGAVRRHLAPARRQPAGRWRHRASWWCRWS